MQHRIRARPLRYIGPLIIFFIVFYIGILILPHGRPNPELGRRVICRSNLRNILIAVLIYQNDKEIWPHQENWCDAIELYCDNPEILQCPIDKTGPCSYAMNENIPADANELPPDLVLLFESAPGWNQTGGADDVVTDRHGKPGANIAFADGHVEFVIPEDIPNLRWAVE